LYLKVGEVSEAVDAEFLDTKRGKGTSINYGSFEVLGRQVIGAR
jgi:hypothetical protein